MDWIGLVAVNMADVVATLQILRCYVTYVYAKTFILRHLSKETTFSLVG